MRKAKENLDTRGGQRGESTKSRRCKEQKKKKKMARLE